VHDCSALPGLLSDERWPQAQMILQHSEVLLLTCFFWRTSLPDGMGPRRLADSLIHVLVKGRLWYRVGAGEYVLEPGGMMMIPDGVEHEAKLADGCDHIAAFSIHAHAYTTQNRPLLALFSSPAGHLPGADGWFQQLGLLTHLMGRDEAAGRRFGESLLRALLLQQLLQGNPLREAPPAYDERIWLAICHILKRFADPLTVADLAREAGLGPAQFRKLFRRCTGTTPKAYIQELRLRKARALLQTNPALTVKEAAEHTGFGDPHYLHAVFKQKYGITPACVRPPAG
jgi:AraC-like DNA-binding protein